MLLLDILFKATKYLFFLLNQPVWFFTWSSWPGTLYGISPGPVNNPVGTERGGVFDYWLWLRTPWGKILTQVEVCHPGRKIQYGRHKIRSIGNLGRGTWKSQHVSRSFKVGSFERYWGIFSYKIIKNQKNPKSATRGAIMLRHYAKTVKWA